MASVGVRIPSKRVAYLPSLHAENVTASPEAVKRPRSPLLSSCAGGRRLLCMGLFSIFADHGSWTASGDRRQPGLDPIGQFDVDLEQGDVVTPFHPHDHLVR